MSRVVEAAGIATLRGFRLYLALEDGRRVWVAAGPEGAKVKVRPGKPP